MSRDVRVPLTEWFNGIWLHLSNQGQCDDLGGMEYRRVLDAWIAAGKPDWVALFIRTRANYGEAHHEQTQET